jgi:alpha-ketoglutarate-dependent taurine dioxygenase
MDCMRPMTADTRKLKALLENRINERPQKKIDWQAGGLLVIDNHRIVHARGEAERPDPNRILKRILIGEN